jgi:hypothetical protein
MSGTTTRSRPRKAAPRKAAKPQGSGVNGTNGAHANGAETPEAPYVPPAEVRPPEEFKPPEPPKHPIYGTKRVYSYQPKDGSDKIEFPHINTVDVSPKFFWRIYPLNEMFQSFEWMNQADVPRDIQERVMDLPDPEKGEFFTGWFADITRPQGVSPPGES